MTAIASALITIFLVLYIIFLARQPAARSVSELPVPSADVLALLDAGKKVPAIRAYRQQTGTSLMEAHRVIMRHTT
jgi:ribosomal protein L7/L12